GVHRHPHPAEARSRPLQGIQDAVGAFHPGPRRHLMPLPDAGPPVDHLDPIRAVARCRAGGLLRVRISEERIEERTVRLKARSSWLRAPGYGKRRTPEGRELHLIRAGDDLQTVREWPRVSLASRSRTATPDRPCRSSTRQDRRWD